MRGMPTWWCVQEGPVTPIGSLSQALQRVRHLEVLAPAYSFLYSALPSTCTRYSREACFTCVFVCKVPVVTAGDLLYLTDDLGP